IAYSFGDLTKFSMRWVMRCFADFQSDLTFCVSLSISAQVGFQISHGDQSGIGRIRASVSSLDIWVNASKARPSESCQKRAWIDWRNFRGVGAVSTRPSNGSGEMR